MSSPLSQARAAAACVLSEEEMSRSRGNLQIAENQTILVGQVLGKVAAKAGAVTVAAPTFGGTGNGTLTLADPASGAGVQEGTYRVTCIDPVTNGGLFEVRRPDGTVDGEAKVGTAYDGEVKFTIADGATDFADGDEFALAVSIAAAADEGQFKALDLAATDGAEIAAAVALYPATTGAGETAKIAGLVRAAQVIGDELEWPSGITANQKLAAIQQLQAAGIIVR